jgi:PQQ-dependent catabolism-associated CXXCW motif protein
MKYAARWRAAVAGALVIGWFAAGVAAGARADGVPEPDGFWTGPMGGAVPATLAGAAVVDADAVDALVRAGGAVLVDVAPAPRRPDGLAADALWLPPPHRSLPGSVWLPDVGLGVLEPDADSWYRDRLAALTGADFSARLVIFCHPDCWGSWNAAKRAVLYGYGNVHWFPDGVEGWQDSGRPTVTIEAEPAPE